MNWNKANTETLSGNCYIQKNVTETYEDSRCKTTERKASNNRWKQSQHLTQY